MLCVQSTKSKCNLLHLCTYKKYANCKYMIFNVSEDGRISTAQNGKRYISIYVHQLIAFQLYVDLIVYDARYSFWICTHWRLKYTLAMLWVVCLWRVNLTCKHSFRIQNWWHFNSIYLFWFGRGFADIDVDLSP